MKHKFHSLLLLLFIISALASLPVNAATPANQPTTSINKTVKVNKTFKIKTLLKLNSTQIEEYTFTTNNSKVVSISNSGTVKGLKKGSAIITVTSKTDNSIYAKINVTVKNRYTASQLRLMSAIIYSEAGGESYAGKKAVGIVIMNRVRSKEFPNTVKKVIYQSGQFGPVKNGSLKKSLSRYDKGKLSKKCIKAAKAVLNGDTFVTYKKKTYNMSSYLYFSGYVANRKLQIGNHQFK